MKNYYHYLRKQAAKKKITMIPKTIKFKRVRKATLAPIQYRKTACNIQYGMYGIKLLKGGRLTVKQIEAVRQKISRFTRKRETMWIRGRAMTPLTFKEKGLRMGKGKGDVKSWVWRTKAGDIIFELSPMIWKKAKMILKLAIKKLPLPAILVTSNVKL